MTDIVKELRNAANSYATQLDIDSLLHLAADEIESLRGTIAELNSDLSYWTGR